MQKRLIGLGCSFVTLLFNPEFRKGEGIRAQARARARALEHSSTRAREAEPDSEHRSNPRTSRSAGRGNLTRYPKSPPRYLVDRRKLQKDKGSRFHTQQLILHLLHLQLVVYLSTSLPAAYIVPPSTSPAISAVSAVSAIHHYTI
ncbi:hypothetical protein ACMFMG_008169 [Clarireedia jacksonii]